MLAYRLAILTNIRFMLRFLLLGGFLLPEGVTTRRYVVWFWLGDNMREGVGGRTAEVGLAFCVGFHEAVGCFVPKDC
jgi:hypothetical protein